MTIIGIDPGIGLHGNAKHVASGMDYSTLTKNQRYNLRLKGFDIPHMRRGPVAVVGFQTKASMICRGCGAHFLGLKDPSSKHNYCNSDCYRNSLTGSRNPNFKGGFIQKKCKGCGVVFLQKRSKYQSPYCAPECSKSAMERRVAETAKRRRIRDNVRKSILSYITKGTKMNRKWQDILGYNTKDLCMHLQSQFDSKMSWDNYGSYWHIDHITPVSWFKFTTPDCEGFKKCWAMKNLRPLEAKKNIKKSNKLWLQ